MRSPGGSVTIRIPPSRIGFSAVTRIPTFVLLLVLCPIASPIAGASEVDYVSQIKPLLSEKCYSCHGVLKQEAELRLETRGLMIDGGDSGSVIAPGHPEESLILERVRSSDSDRMPPEGEGSPLTRDQIELIEQWIRGGAEAPEEATPLAPEQHWAFQPITAPQPSDLAKHANPIDALLEAKQAREAIRPQPPAPRSLQLRRLYLDLIGLPPTHQQLADPRPIEEIVDELLASPHHGERWARHWMDIWRYSDWYGLGEQLRNSQKHLWHWRDWIIRSLNQDKGYDRMIQEMLAGDELSPEDPEVLAATGFLARNYYLFNRTTWLDNTIEHTSKAFLGLTMNCAKCHDHKYDPITQVDYYRLRAIFEPHQVRLDPIPGVTDFESDGLPRVFDDDLSIVTQLHVRGDPKQPDPDIEIAPGVPAILASFATPIESVALPVTAFAPGLRPHVRRDRVNEAEAAVRRAEQELEAARQKLAAQPEAAKAVEAEPPAETEPLQIEDDFDAPNPQLWEIIGDHWEYREGSLHQTMATRESHMVRLRKPLPRDFDLRCRYTHTGGATYKSVTFRFDQSDDGRDSNYVYTSAHEPGPKVQVAYSRDGQSSYPTQGRRDQAIEVGRPYQLRVAVRDTLVNVWLDDQFMVAYRLPDRREGFFSLSGFDATVAFDSIQLSDLPSDEPLQEAADAGARPATDPQAAVELAEAKLKMERASLRSLQATFDADHAKYSGDGAEVANRLCRVAAERQTEWQIASAEYRMLADAADSNKAEAAKQQLESAKQKLASLVQADEQPGDDPAVEYESFRAAKKALESPADKESDYPPVYSPTSSGRRLALARWISSPNNPLTARVAVNHVWMRHFGTPLVESVFDFGLRAPEPQHLDVLDRLAAELIQSGWSLKHLHRLIVTSQAYARSSSSLHADPRCLDRDPENKLYWRMNPRRMESQVVRDSLLAFADELDLTVGGPSLDHDHRPPRRSLYFKHSPDLKEKFLETFDNADVLVCYRRSESIVPQQALALVNSELSISMSAKIAAAIESRMPDGTDVDFISELFETILARPAVETEIDQCERFLQQLAELSSEDPAGRSRRRARLVHAILNHNDFITIR